MVQYLMDNLAAIIGMVVILVIVTVSLVYAAKSHVQGMDKKMTAKGMKPMTDDDKQLAVQVFRSACINMAVLIILAFVGYHAGYFIFN